MNLIGNYTNKLKTFYQRWGTSHIFFCGDGSKGIPAKAPYDKIIVTAGAPIVPSALTEQLAENGILIIPVGDREKQKMLRITKKQGKLMQEEFDNFAFVPLLGDQGWK